MNKLNMLSPGIKYNNFFSSTGVCVWQLRLKKLSLKRFQLGECLCLAAAHLQKLKPEALSNNS